MYKPLGIFWIIIGVTGTLVFSVKALQKMNYQQMMNNANTPDLFTPIVISALVLFLGILMSAQSKKA
ncbi:MAG: hypothetical protein ACNS62_02280 [Candidatus Cyclobacteriaceae bacterium M3_2C_046]